MSILRFLTAGESHGPSEVAILEGMPSGLDLTPSNIQIELGKRRGGAGRGGRGKIETDRIKILSGVRFGKTVGSPIALMVENLDFINWQDRMAITKQETEIQKVTNPRPGHADLAGALKYGFDDIRNVLERASARETVMRVAVGAVCKKLLKEFQIAIGSHTIQIGSVKSNKKPASSPELSSVHELDPDTHCLDPKKRKEMKEVILTAIKKKDTLGGVIEIIAYSIPAGLGSYVHFDRKLDSRIAGALMSIPSVKAVEIGEGILSAGDFGSKVHDEIYYKNSKYFRKTNRAGGIEGGVSNGENIVCRVYHKPISTLGSPLKTVDIKAKSETRALIERSDVCIVPRAGVISESMIAFVFAQAFLEKFGGDSLSEIKRNYEGYKTQLSTE